MKRTYSPATLELNKTAYYGYNCVIEGRTNSDDFTVPPRQWLDLVYAKAKRITELEDEYLFETIRKQAHNLHDDVKTSVTMSQRKLQTQINLYTDNFRRDPELNHLPVQESERED